ncbi:MAG: right-handed parallel beta-helix repeat-containing protein [Planctomycetia bacterium]|nr:right-handed parallel beta-helix repeat-containing protein [Planctomycetia bacterium]
MQNLFIEYDGIKHPVTKEQLMQLAADGRVQSDTKLWIGETETICGLIRGIVFGNPSNSRSDPFEFVKDPTEQVQNPFADSGNSLTGDTIVLPDDGSAETQKRMLAILISVSAAIFLIGGTLLVLLFARSPSLPPSPDPPQNTAALPISSPERTDESVSEKEKGPLIEEGSLAESFNSELTSFSPDLVPHDFIKLFHALKGLETKKEEFETSDDFKKSVSELEKKTLYGTLDRNSTFIIPVEAISDYEGTRDQLTAKYDPESRKLSLTLNLRFRRINDSYCSIDLQKGEFPHSEKMAENSEENNELHYREYRILASQIEYPPLQKVLLPTLLNFTFVLSMPIGQDPDHIPDFKLLAVFNHDKMDPSETDSTVGTFVSAGKEGISKLLDIPGKNISFLVYNSESKTVARKLPLSELLERLPNPPAPKMKTESKPVQLPVPQKDPNPQSNELPKPTKNTDPHKIIVTDEYGSVSFEEACKEIADGGTVIVKPGIYFLSDDSKGITLNKSITIIGEENDPDKVEINGFEVPMFIISGGSAKIKGVSLCSSSSKSCINVTSGKPEFTNCLIRGRETGILVSGKDANPRFIQCKIHDCNIGLGVADSGQGIFEKCEFSDNSKAAIAVIDRGKPIVEECKIFDNETGIFIGEKGRGIFRKNRFNDNYKGDWNVLDTAGRIVNSQNRSGIK